MKKKTKKKELFKSRKYRFTTPGQDRDFETLDANRMFKSYEEAEKEDESMTTTAAVADPMNRPLFGRKKEIDVFFKNRIDGRTKGYRETVTRLQARRDASAARDLEQKLNMFGVQSNPFREDTQMENKKYLKTKEGSIEDAVLASLNTETPFNPNDARPTLHLPEKKYLDTKVGSLEKAVMDAMVTETISGNMQRDLQILDRTQFLARYRMSKAQAQRAGAGITHGKSVADVKTYEEHTPEEDAYDYKAKKGAIAAPGSGSIAKAKKAKSSDVNKSIEQQMADARKEEVELDEFGLATLPKSARGRQHPQNPNRDPSKKSPEQASKGPHVAKLLDPEHARWEKEQERKKQAQAAAAQNSEYEPQGTEIDESWKKVKPTDRVQRLDQLSISGWLSKQMGRKGDPHKFNHKVPSIYFDDVDLVVDSDTVVPRALSGNATMADLLKKVQAHAKKKRLRWESIQIREKAYKLPRQLKDPKREKMVGTKKGTKVVDRNDPRYKHHPEHESVEHDDRGVGSQAYTDYIRNLTPGETAVKDPEAEKASSASKQAAAEKKRQITKIDDAVDPEVKRTTDNFKQEKTKMKQDHIIDVAKIKASKVGEEIIVGLLDMGIIKIDENKETGFTVINDPVANRENLLRMAYNTGTQILSEYRYARDAEKADTTKADVRNYSKAVKRGALKKVSGERRSRDRHYDKPDTVTMQKTSSGETERMTGASKRRRSIHPDDSARKHDVTKRGLAYAASEYVPQGTEIDEKKVSSDDYDHATALYKDQWKDRKIADYDKEHDKDSRAKEMRADAEVDRKRMWGLTGDKWKHAKGSSGEVKGKKSEVGNPDPKDAYKKEEVSPLVSAAVSAIGKLVEKDWIKGAIKKPGALHRDLGVPEDEKIPKSKIKAAAKEGGKVGQRARLAITLGKMDK